jgi:nucleotide-binding universal stress UspA family protein
MLVLPDRAINVQFKAVLIATDFSAASGKALRHALAIARYSGAKVYIIHVVSSVWITIAGPDAVAQSTTLALRDLMLLERELVVSGALREMRHQAIVCYGDTWSELQRVIRREGVDLVVVGTHGRNGFKKLALGSVAEQVFRDARCLVLTVSPYSPPDWQEVSGSLLFPTDFSEASVRAFPYALSIAERRKTKLVLLHMLTRALQAEDYRWCTAQAVEQMQAEAQATARQHLRELAAQANCAVEPAFIADFGEPAEGILKIASQVHAEAIVMGLHRKAHVELRSHLLRSTAYDVVCRAICPVLTVGADVG